MDSDDYELFFRLATLGFVMTPERQAQIRRVFEAAAAMEREQRTAFLESECSSDDDLRREVTTLLEVQERIPDWLNKPLLGATRPSHATPQEHMPLLNGMKLGAYTLLREIGHGGMGVVYLAERADGAFQKQVAIKFLQPGLHTAEIIVRFQREREILAALDHPNIARLLDGGTTPDGLPYFIMEYVDGKPIHRWCDERKLSVTRRLELFRSVCSAVEYAHQRLVVHRDLKPSNILVTPDGVVKLLDFGIGKLLGPGRSVNVVETGALERLLTPAYASPEQVTGAAVTTLTDIYSLGVVLYELLTGHRPFRLERAALLELVRVISEEEPTRPSDIITTTDTVSEEDEPPLSPGSVSQVREGDARRLQKRLQGDLDCIVLTALRKEPERRYRSVAAFSEDLGRHLQNLPVYAREDSFWYRAGRFVRRRPSDVLAGALIATSAGVGMITAVWQTRLLLAANLPGDLAVAPLMVLFSAFILTGLGSAIYFTRASLRRTAGALAGGTLMSIASLTKYWLGYSLGWWRMDASLISAHTVIPAYLAAVAAGAAILLVVWRIFLRFGWKGEVYALLGAGLLTAVRERLWLTVFLPLLSGEDGPARFFVDSAVWSVVWGIGLLAMRMVAGPLAIDAPVVTSKVEEPRSEGRE